MQSEIQPPLTHKSDIGKDKKYPNSSLTLQSPAGVLLPKLAWKSELKEIQVILFLGARVLSHELCREEQRVTAGRSGGRDGGGGDGIAQETNI